MFDYRPVTTVAPQDISDSALVRMHADGDKEALGILCRRHHARLMAAAARIAGQDADDAVQEGCLKAYRQADRFRGDSAVTTWLHRIVVNAAIDITRRRPLVAEPADEASPDTSAAQAASRVDLRNLFQQLSRDHQAALLLVDMMDYPVREAAQILDVPEGTIKTRAARARAALAGKLER